MRQLIQSIKQLEQQKRQLNGGTKQTTVVQGTEAAAKENLKRNSKNFHYPREGFVTPIEHSLIYNMLQEPSIYPREVLIQHIMDEDFSEYMIVADSSKKNQNNNNNNRTNNQKSEGDEEPRVSYAQLSALLALSAEKYPNGKDMNVADALGKRVFQCVLRYVNKHDLDRETELAELLTPVEKYAEKQGASYELKAIAGLYVGYTATLVTANPLPAIAGFALWTANMAENESKQQNVRDYKDETARRANIETAGLLEESEE